MSIGTLQKELFIKPNEDNIELSIIMPCLNEAETLETCIKKAQSFLQYSNINGEIIIADNGSIDGSQDIAVRNGARVVNVKEKGYGSALNGGIMSARGKYIIMGDADDSYDFINLQEFVNKLRDGFDLVMGNRFKGGIKPGAMPPLHKYLGNPVLSGIGRLFFKSPIGDFHCGLRGFNTNSIRKLGLNTTGMEFASEMVVKATLNNYQIAEVPTTLSPDGRSRPPHLRSWRDGWRHLKFLLAYCPRWLFLLPGLTFLILGLVMTSILLAGPLKVGSVTFDIHTLLYSTLFIILGFSTISFWLFSKVYYMNKGVIPEDKTVRNIQKVFTLEKGLICGIILFLLGLFGSFYALYTWGNTSFSDLSPIVTMRYTIPSVAAMTIGIQLLFSSFFLNLLEK